MKTDHISKYLTFLQGIKNEFVSNLFFVIGVLMILVIFGLHAACPRGCIAMWRLYSSCPSPGSKGSGYGWINRVHDWTVRRHWRRMVFPNEFKVTLLKYKCQTVVYMCRGRKMSETGLNSTEIVSPLNTCNMCTTFRVVLSQFVLPGVIPPSINSILSNELNYHYN